MNGIDGSNGILALAGQYGFVDKAEFVISHIDTLKTADSLIANRCGQVLEQTVDGFGVGQESALVLIGLGQALLGNPLTGGVAAATLVNPVAMTCAAVGAIHYGWAALSASEQKVILATVGRAFDLGAELIRAMAAFAAKLLKALLSQESLIELKALVADAAALFGNRLSHVTHRLRDRAAEATRSLTASASQLGQLAHSRLPVRITLRLSNGGSKVARSGLTEARILSVKGEPPA